MYFAPTFMAIIAAGIPGLSMAAGCLLSPKQNTSLPKKKSIRRQPIIPPPTRKVFSLLFRQDKWWQWKLTITLDAQVWLEPTPGHTPGHVAVHLASKGQRAVLCGDLIRSPLQCLYPDWKYWIDFDQALAIQTENISSSPVVNITVWCLTLIFQPLPLVMWNPETILSGFDIQTQIEQDIASCVLNYCHFPPHVSL